MSIVLRVIDGPFSGREYRYDGPGTFLAGRSSRAEFSVPDDGFLSRRHFQIELDPPRSRLRDLGSTNGTKVNGVRVSNFILRDGDVVQAGSHGFEVGVEVPVGAVTCLGCGAPRSSDRPPSSGGAWLCDACAAQYRRFPHAAPGYWIEEQVGGGGMGEVYRARRMEDNRPVAIKMMSQAVATSDRAGKYFKRELSVLRNLRHPHIVAYYDTVEVDGQFQLIMEYVDGKGARQWVEALPGPLSVPSAARLGVQLLMALDHAHGKGYVHRDIKPSNLLVYGPSTRPIAKLSDFGLAKSVIDNGGFTGVTAQGDVGGSLGFMAPDHLRDFREAREPADIYSAGATLYYLLARQYPYFDFDPRSSEAYSMILEHPAVPLRVHRPDVPESLDKILRKALSKNPRDRWPSASAMANALRPLLDAACPATPDE
ncbi:MAG: FHA domain-containing serine/threonine-protein kinase [Isosphaeraceae bacterium]